MAKNDHSTYDPPSSTRPMTGIHSPLQLGSVLSDIATKVGRQVASNQSLADHLFPVEAVPLQPTPIGQSR